MSGKKFVLQVLSVLLVLFGLAGISFAVSQDFPATLSTQEKIEDFEHLYQILKENYPFFHVLKRERNYDWLAHKEEFLEMIKKTSNDIEFYSTLSKIVDKIENCHTKVRPPYFYSSIKNILSHFPRQSPWIKVLNNPKSEKMYSLLEKYLPRKKNSTVKKKEKNIETKIIKDKEIAYVKIPSFGYSEKDHFQLNSFWYQIRNYPFLIIDIRGNGGGSDTYWSEFIVEKLNKQKMRYSCYAAFRGGDYLLPFVEFRKFKLYPIEQLPSKENYPPELKTDFKYFIKLTREYQPGPFGFKGEIFLLVDSSNCSSAESFSVFCKATGWATLVGERTGGDGVGIDPLIVALPNSGLIVTFPAAMGLNPDGSANEEMHTYPDIVSQAPLNKVLEIIEESKR